MKVFYDSDVDALYLRLDDAVPDGVVEVSEGGNLDSTTEGKIVGIEILHASEKFEIDTIMTYSLDLNRSLSTKDAA